jgi:hypothetical protein
MDWLLAVINFAKGLLCDKSEAIRHEMVRRLMEIPVHDTFANIREAYQVQHSILYPIVVFTNLNKNHGTGSGAARDGSAG